MLGVWVLSPTQVHFFFLQKFFFPLQEEGSDVRKAGREWGGVQGNQEP